MLFTFVYLYSDIGFTLSFNPLGDKNAPCVDGVETKSKHNKS